MKFDLGTVKSIFSKVATQVAVSAAMVAVDQAVRSVVDTHIKRRYRVREEKNASK